MTEPRNPSDDIIARELEALGEEPLDAEELAMLAAGGLDDEPAVASTARLIELSLPREEPANLSELDRQRVWRTIEQRRGSTREAASPRPTRVAPWLALSLAVAAAAVMMIVLLPGDDERSPTGPSAAEVAEVGEQARSALRALDDGLGDTARAERLTADYQRRLEATP
jgi:hypothetical protein